MKTFVVALYSNFNSGILMQEILASSRLEAAKRILAENNEISYIDLAKYTTLEDLKTYAFDMDHSIEVLEINKRDWKRYTYPSGTQVAIQ